MFMLNRGGTSETKVDNVIIVFRSVQVARRLTDCSIPVLTAFQGAALKLAPPLLFKTLSTLNPCFSNPDFNAAGIVGLCRLRRNFYTLQGYFWALFNFRPAAFPPQTHTDIKRQIILFIYASYPFFLSALTLPALPFPLFVDAAACSAKLGQQTLKLPRL